jgi:hypothetical protein
MLGIFVFVDLFYLAFVASQPPVANRRGRCSRPAIEHVLVERWVCVLLRDVAVAISYHLLAFLLYARALSLLLRERDLVCSMRSFSASWPPWLTYSRR